MTREAGVEISIGDMFFAIRRHLFFVLILAVVCGIAGGAFGLYRAVKTRDQAVENRTVAYEEELKQYEDNLQMSEEAGDAIGDAQLSIRREWLALARLHKEHPLMQMDAGNCEWDSLSIHFADGSGDHDGTVSDWIATADDGILFGDAKNDLAAYKSDLIYADDGDEETRVLLIASGDWDTASAASYLYDFIMKQARNAGVAIEYITTSHGSGYQKYVLNFQVGISSNLNNMQYYLTNINSTAATFPVPQAPASPDAGISKSTPVKFGLVGVFIGLIIACGLILLRTIRQGLLSSGRQVEKLFHLERLADMSKDSEISLDILNANLDVMVGEETAVMIIGCTADAGFEPRVSRWDEKSDRSLAVGHDIFDNSETIDRLLQVDGIVLGIHLDESRIEDVQRILLRARKLDKQILGYVEI